MKKHILSLTSLILASAPALAQKAGVAVTDIPTSEDTSIVIKKGPSGTVSDGPDYQIVEGKEEIFGDPLPDAKQALASWKTACAEWKKEMREMNQQNILVTLNCSQPVKTKEDYLVSYKSSGSYKVRVRIKDKK